MTMRYSYPKEKIRILLLEGVHAGAIDTFNTAGYDARVLKTALPEEELSEAVASIHILGVRSKTEVREPVLRAARRLLAVGCFCIGTDQVDLAAAAAKGVPVFNAPFSNTRSVAELTMAEVVMLARRATQHSMELHAGRWRKSSAGSHEVRGKTLGIVGYGHIGSQVGLLAEAFGMRVLFFDIARKLPLGNALPVASLRKLLEGSDLVTLHVPDTPETRNMIGRRELLTMRPGSALLNLSRGSVVDLAALRAALASGHLAGAAVDVFPKEPVSNDEEFHCELRGMENVILTPHVGGSTAEAQHSASIEVAGTLTKYLDTGTTTGAVNFPHVELPLVQDRHRVLNIHRNVPGVLGNINRIVAGMGGNISAQHLGTRDEIGYLIMDLDQRLSKEVKRQIDLLDTTIKTRLLF